VADDDELTDDRDGRWAAQDAADHWLLRELARARAPATRDPTREEDAIARLLAGWDAYIEDYARLKAGPEGPDVAQDARRRLAGKLRAQSSFDVPFNAVVVRCLRDAVAEHYRWQRRHGTDSLDEKQRAACVEEGADPAERSLDPRTDQRVLRAALAGLGQPDARIVYMKSVLDRPAGEIGARLGLTEANVNTRYFRAVPKLVKLIREAVRQRHGSAED
jgi:RNA polymerase sigma factor (sigma-70 family)